MSIKGLEQAIANLNSISTTAVPRAAAHAINRIAVRAIGQSSTLVSKETKIPRKFISQRSRLSKASGKKTTARIKVNRGDFPVIKLGVKVQLSRRKGLKRRGARSVLYAGRFRYPGAFAQKLKNGRWHVMQRSGKPRYPIDVVKIPTAVPLTTAFRNVLPVLMDKDMPEAMRAMLKNQLRLILKR